MTHISFVLAKSKVDPCNRTFSVKLFFVADQKSHPANLQKDIKSHINIGTWLHMGSNTSHQCSIKPCKVIINYPLLVCVIKIVCVSNIVFN